MARDAQHRTVDTENRLGARGEQARDRTQMGDTRETVSAKINETMWAEIIERRYWAKSVGR